MEGEVASNAIIKRTEDNISYLKAEGEGTGVRGDGGGISSVKSGVGGFFSGIGNMIPSPSGGSLNFGVLFLLIIATVWQWIEVMYMNLHTMIPPTITRVVVYIVISIFLVALIPDDKSKLMYEQTGLVLFYLFGIPLLHLLHMSLQLHVTFELVLTIIALMPWYLIYALYFKNLEGGKFVTTIKFLLFLTILVAVLSSMATAITFSDIGAGDYYDQPIDVGRNIDYFWNDVVRPSLSSTLEGALGVITGVQEGFDRQINQTLGREYQSEIERTREQTGIVLEDFTLRSQIREFEDINYNVPVRIRTFEEHEEVQRMDFDCYAERGDERINGTANPQYIEYRNFDAESVLCTIENVSRGRYEVFLEATFEFETWGYAPFYFIRAETIEERALAGERIDSRAFGIPRRPIMTHTNAPVRMGMNQSGPMPIEVFGDRETTFPLDFGVENRFLLDGEINNINEFNIITPDTIDVDRERCTLPYDDLNRNVRGLDNYHNYVFNVDTDSKILQVSCAANIAPERRSELIEEGVDGITEATIVGVASYKYSLRNSARVEVVGG